ncbi:Protein kinase-like protein SgK493 [Zootermopsis nevadensis]|uniref:Protein kinase-like protein SgK493 n=1 Tax=Zootermopsis nevadensis TaxID=136037 RepID=A0A067RK27_ZOONE|nr:Protein kinase-like protein SgK493 [Zootermopsis nevadensis]
MVTELGDPLDTVRLLQLSWEDRLRLALGISQILHHLAHSPLGSLSMNDFRRQQFVLVGGTLKLSDVDDLGVGEPACETDADCVIGGDSTPEKDENNINDANTTEGLSCVDSWCVGHNERLNIWHAGQHFIRLFLPLSAPASLEPHIQELLAAYARPAAGGWNSARILGATQRLVARFVSGDYMVEPSTKHSSTSGNAPRSIPTNLSIADE